MKRRSLTLAAVLLAFVLPASAFAMGSGDKFVDAQTGLTYSVNKPTQTLGLKLSKFQLIICAEKKEQWIYAKYGSGKKFLEIMETMAGVKCSNPGLSKKLPSVSVNGIRANVYVYCDPTNPKAFRKCTVADIARVGGYLLFTTKPTQILKGTEIQVQGIGGVTYAQLISVAKGFKPL